MMLSVAGDFRRWSFGAFILIGTAMALTASKSKGILGPFQSVETPDLSLYPPVVTHEFGVQENYMKTGE